jgi:hypothetical protein
MMATKTAWAAALACTAALAACGGGDGESSVGVVFAEVEASAFSGVRTPRFAVVNDDAAWATLWAEHTSFVSPPPARPAVDFSVQSVAAVFLGDSTDCQRPVIESVERTSAPAMVVNYRLVGPGPAALCPAVVTAPAHVVRFGNADRLPVAFRRIQ